MAVLILSVCLMYIPVSIAFNLDPRFAIIIEDPNEEDDSYFGYDINFWKESVPTGHQHWLIVGAPRHEYASYTNSKHKDKLRPGTAYRCMIDKHYIDSCFEINIDLADARIRGGVEKKEEAWIGGSIAVEEKIDGIIVVCAPNYMLRVSGDDIVSGMCYQWSGEGKGTKRLTILPSETRDKINMKIYGNSHTGLAAIFVQNTSDLLVGAPGFNIWSGAMAAFNTSTKIIRGKPFIDPLRLIRSPTSEDSYMGYAVASGRFHSLRDAICYVTGAPRADNVNLTGEVYIYGNQTRIPLTTLRGTQMGEYFGASLLAMDINNDNLDDLIVGAPLYYHTSADSSLAGADYGTVYVYINRGEAELKLYQNLIGSSTSEARFGTALAKLGDINKDGFLDFAVGAPYEGKGVVYIYFGNGIGFDSQYSQRIAAADISDKLSGFGISIAPGTDVDGNSFNDVAVGSYESAHAVLIRSYPIIHFHPRIEPSVKTLHVNATMFSIKGFLKYTSQAAPGQISTLEATIRLKTTLGRALFAPNSDRRTVLNNDSPRNMKLQRDKENFFEFYVHLKEGNNYLTPLEIEMTYEVSYNPMKDNKATSFCSSCPLMDLKKPSLNIRIPFSTGCKSIEVCKSDLNVRAHFLDVKEPFIWGSNQTISLKVYVTNFGDPAYTASLYLQLCPGTRLVRIPPTCRTLQKEGIEDKSVIKCNLENPLLEYDNRLEHMSNIQFDVDVSEVSINQSLLLFNFNVSTISEEQNKHDNTFSLSLDVHLAADLAITGQSKPSQVLLSKNASTTKLNISHIYEVVNEGPSPVELVDIQIDVEVPEGLRRSITFLQIHDPQVLLREYMAPCAVKRIYETDPTTALPTVLRINCTAGPLKTRQDKVIININMTVDLKDIEEAMEGNSILELTTSGNVSIVNKDIYSWQHSPNRTDTNHVKVLTVFFGETKAEETPSWIIPLGVAIGVLLLTIIIMSLVKVGFFKRKLRDRLQSVKDNAAEEDFGSMDSMDFAEELCLNKAVEDDEDDPF